jgi:polysaccharide pyruvyl transferase WcaK-like protein
LLSQGKYQEGWEEYEWRLHSPSFTESNPPRVVPFPKWDGSSLTGKTLLINPEQGIGEELMFASCYGEVIAQAERCLIECDPRLSRLFARSFPTATIVPSVGRFEDFPWSASLPHVDFRISAASLPRFCRNSAGDFPAVSSYLRVDDTQRAQWRRVLAAFGKSHSIGISWVGGRDPRSAKARSIPLAEWQPIFAAVDASFVNLQYGQHAEEIAQFHQAGLGQLHTLPEADALRDPDGFMALIAELDLVISIDNSTVFMAGAVGTPVWILLPSSAEWRWQGAGDRTPWYPHATLHRQREPGIDAWRALIRDVAPRLPRYLDGLASRSEMPMAQDDSGASSPGSILSLGDMRATERAVLLNDTRSWYHWGCSCTSLALHSRLRQRHRRVDSLPIHRLLHLSEAPRTAQQLDDDALFERFRDAHGGLIAALRDADTVYINGEGTLHGASTQALTLLYLAYIAKVRLQRRVHIINHSCYPEDTAVVTDSPVYDLYRQVYRQMDFVAVREAVSARVLADMGIEACESFDCLPLFLRAHGVTSRESASAARKVVIAGSVAWGSGEVARSVGDLIVRLHSSGYVPIVLIGADAYIAEDDARFASILQQTAGGCFRLVNATSELEWLRTIADAALLVSGRFHHSIAAAFLDTPFIVMESNTPKIAGLLERLESKSFLSVMQPRLGEALEERARQMLASPHDYLITGEVKERLELLAERNFGTRS